MRKLISLLVVLGMVLVAGHAFAFGGGCPSDYNVGVQGDAYRTSYLDTGGDPLGPAYADGGNYSIGAYNGIGTDGIWGTAAADGGVMVGKIVKPNFRAAGAISWSTSEAELGGVMGSCFGICPSGEGEVASYSLGGVYHRTTLSGNSGVAWSTGEASYSYGNSDQGNVGNLFGFIPYGPEVSGSGVAGTGGAVWRTSSLNSVSTHARSGSFAFSSGGHHSNP